MGRVSRGERKLVDMYHDTNMSSAAERKIAKYIVTSLRRYAAKQKRRLHETADREALADEHQGDELNTVRASVPSAEDEYLRIAPISETIGSYTLYQAVQALTD